MAIPNSQPYPASQIKVGSVLYSCAAWTDEKGQVSTEIQEWIVRSIAAKRGTKSRMGFPVYGVTDKSIYVNLTQKVDHLTWGKRSSKTGDFGWFKTIPSIYRRQFEVGDRLPPGIFTTVRAALVYEIAYTSDSIDWHKEMIATEMDGESLIEMKRDLAEFESQQAALKRRLTRLDNIRAKNKTQAAVAA